MKLYTEKEVRNSMNSMKIYIGKYNENVIDKIIENHIRALGGIELPSDEEIWDKADEELSGVRHYAFMRGSKWMRDKIQGGNK
jgi:hypothetical protein